MGTAERAIAGALIGAVAGLTGCSDELVIKTVSEWDGTTPVAGVRVQVNDGDWATTGVDGEASFEGIEAPYSVRLAQTNDPAAARPHRVWQLIDRTDGRLVIPVDGAGTTPGLDEPTRLGSISGTVTGLSGEEGAYLLVYVRTPYGSEQAQVQPNGAFDSPALFWRGEPSRSYKVHAIEAVEVDQQTRYIGVADLTVTLEDPEGTGVHVTDAVLELAPVEEQLVAGTVTMPDNLDELVVRVDLDFGDGSSMLVDGRAGVATGDFDLSIPVIEEARARIQFFANGSGGAGSSIERTLTPPANDLDLDLPTPVELLEPQMDAAIRADTVFRWTAIPGVDAYSLRVSCDSIDYRMIETHESEATLPQIPDLDPRGEDCEWRVFHFDGPAFGFDSAERPDAHARAWSAER